MRSSPVRLSNCMVALATFNATIAVTSSAECFGTHLQSCERVSFGLGIVPPQQLLVQPPDPAEVLLAHHLRQTKPHCAGWAVRCADSDATLHQSYVSALQPQCGLWYGGYPVQFGVRWVPAPSRARRGTRRLARASGTAQSARASHWAAAAPDRRLERPALALALALPRRCAPKRSQ
jgi:hypothetical protein